MTSIDKFVSYFSDDFARNNNFKTTWNGAGLNSEALGMSCKSIDIPGITINDGVYDGRKFGVGYDFDSFSASFLVDSYNNILFELNMWSEKVYNSKKGKFGFKEDYAIDVGIILYTRDYNEAANIKIINVFPVNISPIPIAWDNSEIMEISVSFDFDRYEYS